MPLCNDVEDDYYPKVLIFFMYNTPQINQDLEEKKILKIQKKKLEYQKLCLECGRLFLGEQKG